MLIVIGGLPGTGKSTLAQALSDELGIYHFSKDELEAAEVTKGNISSRDTGEFGYRKMADLAKSYEAGSVIFDFIASRSKVTRYWPELFQLKPMYIECTCSDEGIHKERIEFRDRNIEGWYELSWSNVIRIQSEYQPLMAERLIVDSMESITDNIERIKKYIF